MKMEVGKSYNDEGDEVICFRIKDNIAYTVDERDGTILRYSLDGYILNCHTLEVNSDEPIEEWKEQEPDVDIGEYYYGVYFNFNGSGVGLSDHIFRSKDEALDCQTNLASSTKYGVLKVGTTIITDIKVKE